MSDATHALSSDATSITSQIAAVDPTTADQLLPLVYAELRKLAAVLLAKEKPGQTLQATALVHEAYLRLVKPGKSKTGSPHWNSRGHFFAAAAKAMRRILVERARRLKSRKHGGGHQRVELSAVEPAAVPQVDLLALNEALQKLEGLDSRSATVFELCHFAGLTISEAAQELKLSAKTVEGDWAYARSWIAREISANDSRIC